MIGLRRVHTLGWRGRIADIAYPGSAQFESFVASLWVGVMLDRIDLEPVFFAPFVSSVMRVEPALVDYNGHLNMAYYNVLFDRCVDEAWDLLGVGADYLATHKHSTFITEETKGAKKIGSNSTRSSMIRVCHIRAVPQMKCP